jgi:SAM-dependent methyltransferase
MEGWYQQLSSDEADAAAKLDWEYKPYSDLLAEMQGSVLDIGGGAGLAGRFLPPDAAYFVIDPSAMWQEERWHRISGRIALLREKPLLVRGVGEALPFRSVCFDAALALWSLNHVSDLAACIEEMHRVLKPGGRAFIVLEDMEPTWGAIARLTGQRLFRRLGWQVRRPVEWHHGTIKTIKGLIWQKLLGKEWPLQTDHLRIDTRELNLFFKGRFTIAERSWRGGYLSYSLKRLAH